MNRALYRRANALYHAGTIQPDDSEAQQKYESLADWFHGISQNIEKVINNKLWIHFTWGKSPISYPDGNPHYHTLREIPTITPWDKCPHGNCNPIDLTNKYINFSLRISSISVTIPVEMLRENAVRRSYPFSLSNASTFSWRAIASKL